MARDAAIEGRLLRWAEAVTIGDGSGYPTVGVLHQSWTPPAAGQRPVMKVGVTSDARVTHAAISLLSPRLRNAIVVHYVIKGSIAHQAELMGCSPETVPGRLARAHVALRAALE